MTAQERSLATLRLWLLLTVAFVVTAAAAGVVVTQLVVGHTLNGARREALSAARSIALRVSSMPMADARWAIRIARDDLPSTRRTELLPVEDGVIKGLVWEPSLASQAVATNAAVVSEDIVDSDVNPAFIAYAPIRKRGTVTALVGLELRADEALADVRHLRTVGLFGLFLAAIFGSLFAAAISRQLLRGATERRVLRLLASPRFVRTTFLEIMFAAIAGTVLVGGVVGIFAFQSLRGEEYRLRSRTQQLEGLYRDIARAAAARQNVTEEVRRARMLGVSGKGVLGLMTATDVAFNDARMRQDQLHEQQVGYIRGVTLAMSFSAILTIISLVLLRATASREHELEEAEHVVARSESARRQVAESLPIGFYTFGPDQIQYCNDAWRRMVEQTEDEEPTEALHRALHPDEKEDVLAALRDAIATGSGFGFGHRIVTREGEVRHVESRGVPIVDERGQLEHVVGFTIDVTARVRTRQLLEAKSTEVEATNARLRQALGDLEDNFEAMVHTLVKAVEAKDPYTAGHSERVMGYSVRIAKALGLSPHEIRVIRMGALVHDIGKIGVPDAILTKPGPLSKEEFAIVRSHPEVGARMIEGIPMFKECVPIVLMHHERLDGSGYPYGASAEALSLGVRIVAVADCFDAMTSTRAYRNGLDPQIVIEELRKSVADGALDERIVAQLADTVRRDGLIARETLRPAA